MANRIFYATQKVAIAPNGGGASFWTDVRGVQSVSMNLNFNLEQVFELGQIEIYENIENIPDVEVTIERVLDATNLTYRLATQGAVSDTLSGRSTKKCMVAVSIYDDAQDAASGTPLGEVQMSGMFVSNISYNFPADGNFTESVTLVGNNRVWDTSAPFTVATTFDNTHTASGLGGVNRREDLIYDILGFTGLDANGAVTSTSGTILPPDIPGISSSGTNNKTNDVLGAHLSNISVSCDLGREEVNELGRKGPYFRFASFPIEVTCDITAISTQGDNIQGTEAGINSDGTNLTHRTIVINAREGTKLNLGTKNKLRSVSYSGGDTGGGQVETTFSYSNFNSLTVTHPKSV